MRTIRIVILLGSLALTSTACQKLAALKSDSSESDDSSPSEIFNDKSTASTASDGFEPLTLDSGTMAGSSVSADDEVLPPGSLVGIGPADSLEGISDIDDLTLYGETVEIAATDADGNPVATTNAPLTVNLVLNESGAALQDTSVDFENLCVLLDSNDGLHFVWNRDAIFIAPEQDYIEFETTKLGKFQIASCENSDLANVFDDAAEAGLTGDMRLWLSLGVQPANFGTSTPAKNLCLKTSGPAGIIDVINIPNIATKQFTTHLVARIGTYVEDETYSLNVHFTNGRCSATGEKPIASFGPFTLDGSAMVASPVSGLLGDASGAFPINQASLVLTDHGSEEVVSACAEFGGLLTPLSFEGATINSKTSPGKVFLGKSPSTGTLFVGASCADRKTSSGKTSAEASDGGSIYIEAEPVAIHYYNSIANSAPAKTNAPAKSICLVALEGNTVLAQRNVTVNAPATNKAAGSIPDPQTELFYINVTNVENDVEIGVADKTCATAGDLSSVSVRYPMSGEGPTTIDVE